MSLHFVDEEGQDIRVGFGNVAQDATGTQLAAVGEAVASLKKDTLDGITISEVHQVEEVL